MPKPKCKVDVLRLIESLRAEIGKEYNYFLGCISDKPDSVILSISTTSESPKLFNHGKSQQLIEFSIAELNMTHRELVTTITRLILPILVTPEELHDIDTDKTDNLMETH